MNICILFGKIISNIEYKFIIKKEKGENNKKTNKLNNKNISICEFEIELENKSKINVKAYNEKADYCYKNLYKLINKKNSIIKVMIEGKIRNKNKIEIRKIEII